LKRLVHPHIISLLMVFVSESDGSLYAVMPLMHGSLFDRLYQQHILNSRSHDTPYVVTAEQLRLQGEHICAPSGSLLLSLTEILVVAEQLADALCFLSSCHVVHRDVTPSNILIASLSSEQHVTCVKLSDFGSAKAMHPIVCDTASRCDDRRVTTLWYRPPECLEGVEQLASAQQHDDGRCERLDKPHHHQQGYGNLFASSSSSNLGILSIELLASSLSFFFLELKMIMNVLMILLCSSSCSRCMVSGLRPC